MLTPRTLCDPSMTPAFRQHAADVCSARIAQKGLDVGVSFYAFFKNKNDNPALLMQMAEWWIMTHKLDHFEKAVKIRQMVKDSAT